MENEKGDFSEDLVEKLKLYTQMTGRLKNKLKNLLCIL